ncbi:MAG: ATP-binding cassette domain-containing protein [Spirochaetaceae bacterium]
MKNITIVLEDVSFEAGGKTILTNVNLEFSPAKTTALLGNSGSGKSVLLKVAAGILTPSSGTVWINGLNMSTLSEAREKEFRRSSGFVFQDGALWANRSVFENVQFPLEVHYPFMDGQVQRQKVENQLKKVGFQSNLYLRPGDISTGEQKMVSLARSMVTNPELLFLDNPLVNLDTGSAEAMVEIIKDLHRRNTTLIGSFSSAELISLVADELVVLHKGEVLISGEFRSVRDTEDPRAKSVLASLFKEAASFDQDILELMDENDLF